MKLFDVRRGRTTRAGNCSCHDYRSAPSSPRRQHQAASSTKGTSPPLPDLKSHPRKLRKKNKHHPQCECPYSMASDNPRNQRQSPHALHVRDVHSLEYRYAAGGETDSPTDPPRTVLKSGTTMRRDSLQMSLGRQLIASVPKDTATPTAQKIPYVFWQLISQVLDSS